VSGAEVGDRVAPEALGMDKPQLALEDVYDM